MAAKTEILRELSQPELAVQERMRDAIEANARAKYYLSLLQIARAQVDHPDANAPDLHEDRARCAIDDESLDEVVRASRAGEADEYRIPRADTLVRRALNETDRMIAPLRDANADGVASFERRLHALEERAFATATTVSGQALSSLTSSVRASGDSLHLLVMDVHKALNGLEAEIAPEAIGAAHVYGVLDEDRPRIAAFARGVAETERLRFGHPGLTTTATRTGSRLLIENDIGETAAHVLVLHVEGLRIDVLHTDVHLQRLRFFQSLFQGFPIRWEDMRARAARALGGDLFYECVGVLAAHDDAECEHFLERIGSRLVFLIDWNRARKQLRSFVGKADAVALLARAAENDVGHRAFLEMGGARFVYDAMAAVVRTPLRFDERLDDVLGTDAAASFLEQVLRLSSEGLLEGRSRSLLTEQVRSELARAYLEGGDRLFGPLAAHARIVAELARALRDSLDAPRPERGELAPRAKDRETRADRLVTETRELAARSPGHAAFRRAIEAADDAADGLEEASFLLTLVPDGAVFGDAYDAALRRLVGSLVSSSEAYVEALEAARHFRNGLDRASTYAFLDAVERVVSNERETDRSERQAIASLVGGATSDGRIVLLAARVAAELEDAADALMHAVYVLRDHVLAEH